MEKNHGRSRCFFLWQQFATVSESQERLLQEERLAGATLLIFANKQDLPGAMCCPLTSMKSQLVGWGRSVDEFSVPRTAAEIRDFLQLEKIKRRHWLGRPSSSWSRAKSFALQVCTSGMAATHSLNASRDLVCSLNACYISAN